MHASLRLAPAQPGLPTQHRGLHEAPGKHHRQARTISELVGFAYDGLVGTHVWVAGAVTSLTAFACHHLELGVDVVTLAIAFLSTLLIYNLDSALDLKQLSDPSADPPEPVAHSIAMRRRRAQWLVGTALASLVLVLGLARPQTALLVVIGASIGCMYAVPIGARKRCLKALPGSKSIVVGSAVAIAAVAVPLAEHGVAWSSATWSILFWLAALTVTNATLFDIRDFEQDSARGLKTVVVLFGVRRVRVMLVLLLSACFALLGSSIPSLVAVSLCLWLLMTPLILLLGPASPRALFALALDGALFVPWLCTMFV